MIIFAALRTEIPHWGGHTGHVTQGGHERKGRRFRFAHFKLASLWTKIFKGLRILKKPKVNAKQTASNLH